MNMKTVGWMALFAGILGFTASAFAAPSLLEIQAKTSIYNCNPSASSCLPTKVGSISWGNNQWGGPGTGTPPPKPPPRGLTRVHFTAAWRLADLLFVSHFFKPDIRLSSAQPGSLSRPSKFPLENRPVKVKFWRDAKTHRYILDFGAIEQTANPLELKLVLKLVEQKKQGYVADFVFKIDASSPGAFSTELPPRDEKASDGSFLTIKGLVRGPVKPDDKAK
jgi:hypothetical protein